MRLVARHTTMGTTDLWSLVQIHRNGRMQLALDYINGIAPTFAPWVAQAWQIDSTGYTVCPSLAVGQDDRALLGWTSVSATQWPKLEGLALRLNGQQQRFVAQQEGPGTFATQGNPPRPRVDYCPQAAVAYIPTGTTSSGVPICNAGTCEWLGIAWDHLLTPGVGTLSKRTAFFCRASSATGGTLCQGW